MVPPPLERTNKALSLESQVNDTYFSSHETDSPSSTALTDFPLVIHSTHFLKQHPQEDREETPEVEDVS